MIELSKANADAKSVIYDIIKACTDSRARWVKDWVRNYRRLAAFTEEDVYLRDPDDASSEHPAPLDDRWVTSFNITRSYFQRLLSRLMAAITKYQVMAASTDKEDTDAAKGGGHLLQSRTAVDSGKDFEGICRAISYLFGGGPSYLLIEGVLEGEGKTGDVETLPVLPMDVYYYPGVLELNDSPAIVVRQRVTRQYIERRFPVLAAKIKEDTNWDKLEGAKWPDEVNFERLQPNLNAGLFEIRRLFIRPCDDFEKGAQFVMFKDEKKGLQAKYDFSLSGNPDTHYPLEEFRDVPMGPFYEDRGRMTISGKMQTVIDIAASKFIDSVIEGPQIFMNIPPTAGNKDDITNKPIVITQAPPGQEITAEAAPVPNSLIQIMELAHRYMDEAHSQHAPSRGEMPGARTSGKALEEITAADASLDEPLLAMIRRTMGRVGKRILMEGKAVWGAKHVFSVLGKHGIYETKAFVTADLQEGFDVRVLPDQGLPQNKASRMQLVVKGLQQGLFSDDPAARRGRDLLGVVVDDDAFAIEKAEKQLIRLEEDQIEKGEMLNRNWSDNDAFHLEEHKGTNTERLARQDIGSPEVIKAATFHANQHSKEMAKKMQAQLQLAAGPQAGAQGASRQQSSVPQGGAPQ